MSHTWMARPKFDIDMVLGVVLWMLHRSQGLDRFDVARALITDGVGSIEQRDLCQAVERHYESEAREAVQRHKEQISASRRVSEDQRRAQATKRHKRMLIQTQDQIRRELFTLTEEELLMLRRAWRKKNPSTQSLMTQAPRGLSVNAPD